MKTTRVAFIVSLLLGITSSAWAGTLHFAVKNYKEAEKSRDFIRFDMKSTKLGLLTTSFTGFVKEFDVAANPTETAIEQTTVSFLAEGMDTDVGARNDKMWNLCLDYKKTPKITVAISDPIPLNTPNAVVNGTIELRGEKKPIQLTVTAKTTPTGYAVDGVSNLDIFELGLPDPSIIVAKVDPKVKLSFHVEAPK